MRRLHLEVVLVMMFFSQERTGLFDVPGIFLPGMSPTGWEEKKNAPFINNSPDEDSNGVVILDAVRD